LACDERQISAVLVHCVFNHIIFHLFQSCRLFCHRLLFCPWKIEIVAVQHTSFGNNNGFFDLMEFDLDGDKVFEQRLSMKELGLDDRCQVINTASMKYEDFVDLESKVSDTMWKNAEKAVEVAKAKKLNTKWYALMLQPKSTRERYHYGFWLQFYLYNDLKDLAERTNDKALASVIDKAYLQGKWELIK